MARDLDDESTEKLEAHVRSRITPEFIELMKRYTQPRAQAFVAAAQAATSAEFNYRLGGIEGSNTMIDKLETLLSEANNPEAI